MPVWEAMGNAGGIESRHKEKMRKRRAAQAGIEF